jgi:orotidine-5'-phosphate decarboxylase
LDLKLHDIPNTVARAALRAGRLGVEFLTVHITGGPEMFAAIRAEFSNLSGGAVTALAPLAPKILGVSVLTSFNQANWDRVMKAAGGVTSSDALRPIAWPIERSVNHLVEAAVHWGVDGVVCSPMELSGIRAQNPDVFTVVPGIRPEEPGSAVSFQDDQARVTTPRQAKQAGASAVVVGRPITKSSDPLAVVQGILRDLE